MDKKLQIFISSTYIDLKEERQAAVEAILSAGHIPAGMELFNAGNDSQLETIQRWINESDVYMLILGGRYGSVEPIQKLSYTEIEYRYALEKEKPVFAVYITEKALEAKLKKLKKIALEDKEPKKLEEFRKLVLSKICRPFEDCKDIKIAIHETLNRFSREYKLSGWISGKELMEYENVLKENVDLKFRINELESLSASISKVNNDKLDAENKEYGNLTFLELGKILNSIKVNVPSHLTTSKQVEQKSLATLFLNNENKFNIGVQETFAYPEDLESFLFSRCAPQLLTFGLVEKDKRFKIDKFTTSQLGLKFMLEFKKSAHDLKVKKGKKSNLDN